MKVIEIIHLAFGNVKVIQKNNSNYLKFIYITT
ncbi:hypothetical protein A5847_000193, partial [Enterococcus faecium]